MSNYAVIRDGVVENIVVLDDVNAWTPPQGTMIVLVPEGVFVDLGFTYDGQNFVPPEEPPEDGQ